MRVLIILLLFALMGALCLNQPSLENSELEEGVTPPTNVHGAY